MNLDDFNIKNLGRDLLTSNALSSFVDNFINELKDYLEKGYNRNNMNVINQNKYSGYWEYQNFMEDNVSATIGLSRYGNDITYYDELSKVVDDSIMEITEKEGTLYRNQFPANGSSQGQVYDIEKFENGEITTIRISKDRIPKAFQDKDIIFQYSKNDNIKIRDDLKEEVINLASKKAENLREKEQAINAELKKEGHIYEALEDDGYIFLNDLTEERDFSIEDIDFVVDNYEGDGKYQVINGEYKKIE